MTPNETKPRSHPSPQQRTRPHLRVSWRLLCKSSAVVEVFKFVLLINFVIAFTSCAACHVLPHPVIPLLFLRSRKAGRWKEVKEKHSHRWVSDKTCRSCVELMLGDWKIRKVLGGWKKITLLKNEKKTITEAHMSTGKPSKSFLLSCMLWETKEKGFPHYVHRQQLPSHLDVPSSLF